jgi:LysM domain
MSMMSTAAAGARQVRRSPPVRLTRRGRAVLAGLVILLAVATLTLFWMISAGGVQASGQGQPPRSEYRGMTRVVVRQGQTLWSIAASAEPTADPRIVVQQIIEVNALTGTDIRTGELLWVPKG